MSINENEHIVNKNIHSESRRKLMEDAGFSVTTLANEVKYTRQAVNDAIVGESRSYRCHAIIAAFFKKSLAELWPDIYCVVPNVADVKKVNHG